MAQRAKACTGCHGPQGRSRPDGYIPRLAGKPAGYLHEQLTAFQQGRRRHDGMARMLEPLGDEMLWALAGHFEALEVPYPAPVAPGLYSPLAGNPSVTQPDIRNLVQMLQHGGFAPATRAHPRPFGMPPQELTVAETTAVLNHLRQNWGHRASAVADVDVIRLRR